MQAQAVPAPLPLQGQAAPPVHQDLDDLDDWERVEADQRCNRCISQKNCALVVAMLAVLLSALPFTAPSICASIDPTMQAAPVKMMKSVFPPAISRPCFEGVLDSCIRRLNGTVLDVSRKQIYLETWQVQGFPASGHQL